MIEIDIVMEGYGSYTGRLWPAVPRVGDEIMLRRVHPTKREVDPRTLISRPKLIEEHGRAVVKAAVWGTSEASTRMNASDNLRVSIVCEWKETIS